MKCKVCGAESGKFPLCRVCNIKKEKGEVIKCSVCGDWHLASISCAIVAHDKSVTESNSYIYNLKKRLISKAEQSYYTEILSALPKGYHIFPQINLASFIEKNDNSPFHNELFRNVDFLITDDGYQPLFIIEINDSTHLTHDRKSRDEKVKKICEEAGIPIVNFWTSYGVNADYIQKKISETLATLPVKRIHHFNQPNSSSKPSSLKNTKNSHNSSRKSGCYVATCIYGSYNCPEVWTLRRYRDTILASTWYGRSFIRFYYLISPTVVKLFGKFNWFHKLFKKPLNKLVFRLTEKGIQNTPYHDLNWR